jgi:hypothetical protein
MEWHDGQRQVEHHLKVVETAARYHIAIDAHEPVKDTGLRRTYPNWVAREGARGMEYNAWGRSPIRLARGNAGLYPHVVGADGFTPGVLSLEGADHVPLASTLAKQLRLYLPSIPRSRWQPTASTIWRNTRVSWVHPRGSRRLGRKPPDRGQYRRICDLCPQGSCEPGLVRGRRQRRDGAHADAGLRSCLRARPIPRRSTRTRTASPMPTKAATGSPMTRVRSARGTRCRSGSRPEAAPRSDSFHRANDCLLDPGAEPPRP